MVKKKKHVKGELIFGIHPLLECIKAKKRKIISLYTTKPEPKQWALVAKLLPSYPFAIQYVSRDVLSKMAGTTDHQGIVAWVQSFVFRKKPFDISKQTYLILLDSIQDPRNVGAILRSAYCTGVHGVIMTTLNSAPLNAIAIKSSAGLAEHLEIQLVKNAQEGLVVLKEQGYTNYLAMLHGANVEKVTFNLPLCLVIGNEAKGIAPFLKQYGTAVTLAQRVTDTSYNASVAAGILMYMVGTQQKFI